MAGVLYLGNQMVSPVIVQDGGEPEPFPVRTIECELNESGYVDGSYLYNNLYDGYTEKPFYFDASSIKAMEIVQGKNYIAPSFLNAFIRSSIKYIDFSQLSHLPTQGTITGRRGPLAQIISFTTGVHIYFRALTTQTYFNPNIFQNMCGQATNAVIHFPSNLESIISGLSNYPNFGGTNTTIAFDLPATS